MKLDIELSEQSIDRAIRLIDSYTKDLDGKSRVLVDHIAQKVEDSARVELQQHVWSGETIASLHTEKLADRGHTKSSKVTVGGAAVWLEFGTGVVANGCAPGEFMHPKAQELGMYGIGEYGRGLGSDPNGWVFFDDVTGSLMHTYGIPATMFMYHSAWAGRRLITPLAREVFHT